MPARRTSGSNHAAPGRLLLHPVAIAALAILIVNDHLLKAILPGVLTGKLSDLAGLIVFPLMLSTIVEVARPGVDRRRSILASIVATVAGFTAVKTTVAGAGLYGWSLGIGQWVATLGPLRAATLAPATVVADPTDLVALPAVLVALWIARADRPAPSARAPNRPSAAALSMLVVAGLATMATSQGSPTASAEFEAELHLTEDAPVAVRRLDFTIAEGDDDISSVTFTASVWERIEEGANELRASSKVRLSLIADEADVEIPIEQGFISPSLDFTELCATACEHGVTLVARLAPGAPHTAEILLDASIFVSGDYREGDDQSMDTSISLVEDVAARIDGSAPSLVSTASGSLEVRSDVLESRRTIVLAVGGDALRGPLAFPLVGALSVGFVVESASGNPAAAQVTVSTAGTGDPMYLEVDAVPITIDWLRRCDVGVDCVVPIDIAVTYDPFMNAPVDGVPDGDAEPTEAAPGFVRVKWTVEARLEAFDGRALPADAMTLVTDRPPDPASAMEPGCRLQARLISCSDQPLPSGSVKNANREPGVPSGPSCCTSVICTPRSARPCRTASMSSTTSCGPLVDPGSPSGIPSPMTTEQHEPGGVIWTTRIPGPGLTSWSRSKPTCSV